MAGAGLVAGMSGVHVRCQAAHWAGRRWPFALPCYCAGVYLPADQTGRRGEKDMRGLGPRRLVPTLLMLVVAVGCASGLDVVPTYLVDKHGQWAESAEPGVGT